MATFIAALLALVVVVSLALVAFTAWTARRVDRILPPPGQFIDIDGSRIHYVDKGRGEPIVMIPGLGAQLRHLTYAMLDMLATDYRVIVIDRPGAGNSTRPRTASASIRAQAEIIAKVIRALGLERPLVVGHSMGGAVALAIAVEHPDVARGLVLIAPLTQVEDEAPPALKSLEVRSPLARGLIAWTVATPLSIITKDAMLAELFGPEPPPRDFATRGGALLGLRPQAFITASEDMVALADQKAELEGIIERYGSLTIPTAILYGTGDRILDYRKHGEQTAAQIPGAQLDLVEGGHMLPLTMPDRAVALVRSIMSASSAA